MFIRDAILSKGKVLVYRFIIFSYILIFSSQNGRSRAPAIVVAYLIKRKDMNLESAIFYVTRARKSVEISDRTYPFSFYNKFPDFQK